MNCNMKTYGACSSAVRARTHNGMVASSNLARPIEGKNVMAKKGSAKVMARVTGTVGITVDGRSVDVSIPNVEPWFRIITRYAGHGCIIYTRDGVKYFSFIGDGGSHRLLTGFAPYCLDDPKQQRVVYEAIEQYVKEL